MQTLMRCSIGAPLFVKVPFLWLHRKAKRSILECNKSIRYPISYNKTCVKWTRSKRQTLVLKTDNCLMQVKSIAKCSKGSILRYFRPSLNYHLSLRSLLCLFLSGRFTQVLLYHKIDNTGKTD